MVERYVTVAQYEFLPEAETVRMHLEREGIQSMLADAEAVCTDWALGNAIGYIKLQVPESQANAAIPLVEEMRARKNANAKARMDDAETNRCLACGVELPIADTICPACGWSYASDDVEVDPEESDENQHEFTAEVSEPLKPSSWSDDLRTLKHPFVWMLLAPVFAVAAMSILGLMQMVLHAVISPRL